jgi:hypothetical protein
MLQNLLNYKNNEIPFLLYNPAITMIDYITYFPLVAEICICLHFDLWLWIKIQILVKPRLNYKYET